MAGRILLTFCFGIRLQSWGFNTKLAMLHTQIWFLTPLHSITIYSWISPSKPMGWPLKKAAIRNRQAQLNLSVEKGRSRPYTTYIWVLSHIIHNLCLLKGKHRKKCQHVARCQKCDCTIFQTHLNLKTSTRDAFSSMFITTKPLYKQHLYWLTKLALRLESDLMGTANSKYSNKVKMHAFFSS